MKRGATFWLRRGRAVIKMLMANWWLSVMFAHMKTSWTINSLKMCYILSAFCLLITSNHGDRCMWWIRVNSFSSWSSYFSFTWHNYKIGKCFGPQEQSKAIVKGLITKHRFKVRKGVKRAFFAALPLATDSWKARATGKELSSRSCAPLFFYAHIPFLRPLRRLEKNTVKTQMYHPSFECGFCAFFPFFSVPTGEEKTYFLFCPLPLVPWLPSQVTIEISCASACSVGKGRQEQKGGMSAFLSGLPSRPFQPLHPVNEGWYHRIEEPCYPLFCL